jgi:hypothetical protein
MHRRWITDSLPVTIAIEETVHYFNYDSFEETLSFFYLPLPPPSVRVCSDGLGVGAISPDHFVKSFMAHLHALRVSSFHRRVLENWI